MPGLNKIFKSQILLFLLIGGVSTIINYSTFYILLEYFHVKYIVASVIGYFTGVIFGYYFNFKYTFTAEKETLFKKLPAYIGVYLTSVLLSSLLLYFLVDYLKFDPKLSNIFAVLQSTITNYLGCRYIVFRNKT